MYRRIWLIAAILVTMLFGVLYVAMQQCLRQGANDPQVSMAQDATMELDRQRDPTSFNFNDTAVDIAYSMAPFILVYDRAGNVVAGNGMLDGEIPKIPFGVLQHTPPHDTHAVTWQPRDGVRIAAVSIQARDYYVVVGRSLYVVESHIQLVTMYVASAWLLTMSGLAVAYVCCRVPVYKK